MADKVINHEELLNKIRRDPDGAIARQLLNPAALTNAIISKRMLGVFDRMDQLQLTSEAISAINYIAEHDHLAYLIFIDRFDLIREIFWKKELFGEQLALIEALEKERAQEKNQQFQAVEQARHSLLLRQQQEQVTQVQDKRLKDEKALINMDLYSYYIQLDQKIHNDFHTQQIQILDKSYNGRMARMNRVVDLAEDDPLITVEDKRAFKKLLKDYQEEYETVRRMPILKNDGSIDPVALKTKSEMAVLVEDKFRSQFGQLLSKYEHLREIHQEEIRANQTIDGLLKENKEVRDEKLAENNEHLVEIKEITKDDLNDYVNNSYTILDDFNVEELPENQHSEFWRSMDKFKDFKTQLNQTEDQEHRKELTKQCITELDYISELVKPQMSASSFEKLANNVHFLHELKIKMDTIPIAFSESQSVVFESPAHDASIQAKDSQPEQPKVHSTALYRQQVVSMRIQQSEQEAIKLEVPNSSPEHEVGEVIKLEEEHEDKLEIIISEAPDTMANIIENDDATAEEKEMAQQVIGLCDAMSSTVRDGVSASQFALLKANIDSLQDKFPELSGIATTLERIGESFESSSRPHM